MLEEIKDTVEEKPVYIRSLLLEKLLGLEEADERSALLSLLSVEEIREIATELAKEALAKTITARDGSPLKPKFLSSRSWVNITDVGQIITQVELLLKELHKKEDITPSLDRDIPDKNLKIKAIIAELNDNKIPKHRYTDVLSNNLFGTCEYGITNAKTFVACAVTDLTPAVLKRFLKELRSQLGTQQFEFYLDMPIVIDGKKTTLESWFLGGIYKEERNEEKSHFEKRQKVLRKCIQAVREKSKQYKQLEPKQHINLLRVETHLSSTHQSADVSHVAAFERILKLKPDLCVELAFSEFTKNNNTKGPRKITITSSGNLDIFVQEQLNTLRAEIHSTQSMTDAELYEKYLATKVEDKFDNASDQLKKVKFFKFQSSAALRYMDEMIGNHSCGEIPKSSFDYKTNAKVTCGLTIEQMIATAYCLGKIDVKGEALAAMILALYDMRRGYDIDCGIDKPHLYEMPDIVIKDSNRCPGGAVNSLIDSLYGIHDSYEKVIVDAQSVKNEIMVIYNKIAEDNASVLDMAMSYKEKRIWGSSRRVTGIGRDLLDNEFKAIEPEFRLTYQEYIPAEVFEGIVLNAANDVKIPELLMRKYTVEWMDADAIFDAVVNDVLPILHYDEKSGYEYTLEYAARLKKGDGLINAIAKEAIHNAFSVRYDIIMYLANSNIGSEHVVYIYNKEHAISRLKGLNIKDLEVLFTSASLKELLKEAIGDDLHNLFAWYCKNIELNKEDYEMRFEYERFTILHLAVLNGQLDVVNCILERKEGRDAIAIEDIARRTPLTLAINEMRLEMVRAILVHPEGRNAITTANIARVIPSDQAAIVKHLDILKAILSHPKCRDVIKIQDEDGQTALHELARDKQLLVIKELLNYPEGQDALTIQNVHGKTPLCYAVAYGRLEMVEVMLTYQQGQDALTIQDDNRKTPLGCAVSYGLLEMVEVMLTYQQGQDALTIQDNNGNTPLDIAIKLFNQSIIGMLFKYPKCRDVIKIQDEDGKTLLYLAENKGDLRIVDNLLKDQKDMDAITIQDNDGDDPRFLALKFGKLGIMKKIESAHQISFAWSSLTSLRYAINTNGLLNRCTTTISKDPHEILCRVLNTTLVCNKYTGSQERDGAVSLVLGVH